jgi:hypothetical protein
VKGFADERSWLGWTRRDRTWVDEKAKDNVVPASLGLECVRVCLLAFWLDDWLLVAAAWGWCLLAFP